MSITILASVTFGLSNAIGVQDGPTEPFFDQSWKLPQIEEVDFAEYGK